VATRTVTSTSTGTPISTSTSTPRESSRRGETRRSTGLGGGADSEAHLDLEADGHVGGIAFSDFWVPFTSLRFWVFFLAFFGLTGTLLALFELAGPLLTLLSAIGMGFGTGFAAAFIIGRLRSAETGIVAASSSHRGKEAVVLLALSKASRGKVRLSIDGSQVDLLARGTDEEELPAGTRVLIIELAGHEVVVVRSPSDDASA
jgi:membrane protein implicated in regulation of membrane protease activity